MGGSDFTTRDDVVQGCWRFLSAVTSLTGVLGSFENGEPYLFQRKPYIKVIGSQSSAIVINTAGTWTSSNSNNTAFFPRLSIEIYVDPIRTAGFSPLEGQISDSNEAFLRWNKVFMEVDNILHKPEFGAEMWGTVLCVTSLRLSGAPEPAEITGQDGLVYGVLFYALEVAL